MESPMIPTPVEAIPGLVADLRESFSAGRSRPMAWRMRQLERFKAMIVEREGDFHAALAADLGKSSAEATLTETAFVAGEIDFTLKHLSGWAKSERVNAPLVQQPCKARIESEPLGVVLIIGAWNYPFQLTLAPLIGALAAGNCALVKPSEVSPATSAAIARWLPEYLDPACVKVVQGGVPETTAALSERFDHIFYTGGGAVGRIVMRAAAEHLTPVTLELGGKSPCVVDKALDLEVAARRIVWGKYTNCGQTCIAPDYVLAHAEIHDALVERLAAVVREFYGEDPKACTDYGRIVNERHVRRLSALMGSGEVACGGQIDAAARYIAPTILTGVALDSPVMADEIFGPILPVIKIGRLGEAVEIINARPKPLALYVFSSDKAAWTEIVERTSSGGVCVNDTLMHIAVPELPFGGVGASGMGAYHGRASFDTFSHRRGVLLRSTRVDPPLRYPPLTENKIKWARRFL